MWIMTNQGILMPAALPAQHCPPSYTWDMQVRSRDPRVLRKVAKRMRDWGMEVGPVVRTPAMDYEARFYCHADDFAEYMRVEVSEIDYVKFKPTTARKGGGGEELHHLYNMLWYHIARFYDSAVLGTTKTKKAKRERPQ